MIPITIQSQDNDLCSGGTRIMPSFDGNQPVIYFNGQTIGRYDTVTQRDFVQKQIAQAIEEGKRLYKMPSPEEAKKMLHENKPIEEAQPEEGLKINPVIKNLLSSIAPSKKAPAAEPSITYAEQTWGRPLTGPECENIIQNMNALIALGCQDPNSIIKEAFKQADLQGVRTMKYIDSILRDWQKRKFITLIQIQKADERFKEIKDMGKPKVVEPGKYDDIYL